MSIMKSEDGTNLIVDCDCKCDDGLRIRVDKDEDFDYYFIMSYTSGNFYKEQDYTIWKVIRTKLKKIWCIIRNKDYCYSEICMNKDDFKEFQEYIASLK